MTARTGEESEVQLQTNPNDRICHDQERALFILHTTKLLKHIVRTSRQLKMKYTDEGKTQDDTLAKGTCRVSSAETGPEG